MCFSNSFWSVVDPLVGPSGLLFRFSLQKNGERVKNTIGRVKKHPMRVHNVLVLVKSLRYPSVLVQVLGRKTLKCLKIVRFAWKNLMGHLDMCVE